MQFTRPDWVPLPVPHNAARFLIASGAERASTDPATREPVAVVLESTAEDCELAISLARNAADRTYWSTSPKRRSDAMHAWASALIEHIDHLAELLTREQGKPLAEARIEISAAADQFRFYAGLTRVFSGRAVSPAIGVECVAKQEPMGVVGIITPWNWPLILLAKSLAPALAAGNACVIKPPEHTPAIVIAALSIMLDAAEVPDGVITCVTGPGSSVGSALVGHPLVDMIAFTGSVGVGRELAAQAGRALQPVVLELGGKSPTIVFADANLDKAVQGILAGSLTTSGQMCTAGSRVIAESSIVPKLRAALRDAVSGLAVGDGLDSATRIGPLISERQWERVNEYVAEGKANGDVVFEGSAPVGEDGETGFFVAPILIEGLPRESSLHREEIFGPVVTLQSFESEDEIIAEANAVEFGLAASVWTSDVSRAWRVSRALNVGTVWVNTHNQFYPEIEVGARKQSGFGDAQGIAGLSRFTRAKLVNFDDRATMWGD